MSNPSQYNVTVSLSVHQSHPANDPLISFPSSMPARTILAPNNSFSFMTTISLYRLFTGNATSWETKSIAVSSQRLQYHSTIKTVYIEVDPTVLGCESMSTESLCKASPKCGFCYVSQSYRILQEITSTGRRLFDRIVPTTENPVNGGLSGYCISTSSTQECQYPKLTLTDESKYYWWIIVFTIPMVVVIIVFLFSLWKQI